MKSLQLPVLRLLLGPLHTGLGVESGSLLCKDVELLLAVEDLIVGTVLSIGDAKGRPRSWRAGWKYAPSWCCHRCYRTHR